MKNVLAKKKYMKDIQKNKTSRRVCAPPNANCDRLNETIEIGED